MGARPDAIEAFIAAVSNPDDEHVAALEPWLAEDVVVAGIVGGGSGKANVIAALAAPNAPKLLAAATWSEPREEADEIVLDATLPAAMPVGGMTLAFRLDARSRIVRVGEQLLPAASVSPQPLVIPPEMKVLIDGALANGTVVIVGYVDAANAPHVSPRGSVQVFSEKQLAMWIREPEGGILKGIAANPNVVLYYRDPKTRTAYTFSGRAWRAGDGETRDAIYANTAEIERNLDGRKRGVAVIVDLDTIEGNGPTGRVRMQRE